MKLKFIIAVSTVLFGSAAYAGDTYILPVPADEYGTVTIRNVPLQQHPFDPGQLNQSPIRGKGQIHVTHTEPPPSDADREVTRALWLLGDEGFACYKPKTRLSRR